MKRSIAVLILLAGTNVCTYAYTRYATTRNVLTSAQASANEFLEQQGYVTHLERGLDRTKSEEQYISAKQMLGHISGAGGMYHWWNASLPFYGVGILLISVGVLLPYVRRKQVCTMIQMIGFLPALLMTASCAANTSSAKHSRLHSQTDATTLETKSVVPGETTPTKARCPSELNRITYYWRESLTEDWEAYEVTSATGRAVIMDWMTSHADALEISKKPDSMGAWIPGNILVEEFKDGSKQETALLLEIPGPGPKATRNYSRNIKEGAIELLLSLFRQHGIALDNPADPLRN